MPSGGSPWHLPPPPGCTVQAHSPAPFGLKYPAATPPPVRVLTLFLISLCVPLLQADRLGILHDPTRWWGWPAMRHNVCFSVVPVRATAVGYSCKTTSTSCSAVDGAAPPLNTRAGDRRAGLLPMPCKKKRLSIVQGAAQQGGGGVVLAHNDG